MSEWALKTLACRGSRVGLLSFSGKARGPGSLGVPGSWYSHGQTTHSSREPRVGTPSRVGTPCPLPFPKRCRRGGRVPAGRGGPGSKGGRGPGSWYSSAYTVSSSVGIPRAGSPQRAGTPRTFPVLGSLRRTSDRTPCAGELVTECTSQSCKPPDLLQESLGSFGPGVSPKTGGARESVQRGVSRALRAPGPESVPTESVPGVSKRCPEHAGTLSGHFLDTLEPGREGP